MTESFFQPATTPFQRELICHHFHHKGIQHELFHLDKSHRVLRRILSHCSHNQTTNDQDTKLPHLPAVGPALSFMGPGVPSLAVFFTGARVPSLDVFLSSRPFGTCFIKPSADLLADSLSGLCFVLQARAAEYFFCLAESPSVLTPTAVFATRHTPWYRRDAFLASPSASLRASPSASLPASLHASPRP